MTANFWQPGDWNATCSMCGRKRKAGEMVQNWQGQYRCPQHNEERHPQDFVRATSDNQSVPWAQPPAITYTSVCFPNDQSAIPGDAIPGCVRPGYLAPGNDIF